MARIGKISFSFGAAVGILLTAVSSGALSSGGGDPLQSLEPTAKLLDDIQAESYRTETELLRYALTGQNKHLSAYRNAIDNLELKLSFIAEVVPAGPPQQDRVAELRRVGARQIALLRTMARPGRQEANVSARNGAASEAAADIRYAAAALQPASFPQSGAGHGFIRKAWEVIPASTLLVFGSVLVYGGWTARSRTKSFRMLLTSVETICEGALDYKKDLAKGDEYDQMTTAFKRMAELLSRIHRDLRHRDQVLLEAAQLMTDGFVLCDRDGRVLLSNRVAARILGGDPAEAPVSEWGSRYGLYLSGAKTPCGREDMPALLAIQGRAAGVDLCVRKAGQEDRFISMVASPVADQNSDPWGVIIVLTDNTERKQAGQALQESEEKLRKFIETTNEWFWGIDGRRKLTYSNSAVFGVLGYSPSQIAGKPIVDFVHPDDREQFAGWLEGIGRDGNGGLGLTLRWLHAHGTERWLESNAVPIRNADGQVAGYRGTNRDITLRHMAEAEVAKLNAELRNRISHLDAANKELEAFSYSVSHDLRAPLRSIDGFSQALLEDYQDRLDAEGQEYLRRVRGASQRMAQLIDDLLNLSRVTRHQFSPRTVDLAELAEAAAARLRELDPARDVEISIEDRMVVRGDARLLHIAMDNLLGNAWKFTRKEAHARIEIGNIQHQGELAYFVRDNGVGFDMAYADKLFGAFQRLHAVDEFEGSGIGLATVQRIIHRHGGRIWAQAAVGEGATFYFTVPEYSRHE